MELIDTRRYVRLDVRIASLAVRQSFASQRLIRAKDVFVFGVGDARDGGFAPAHALVHALHRGVVRALLLLRDALRALDQAREVQDLLVVRGGGGTRRDDALVEALRRQARLRHRVQLRLEELYVLAAVRQQHLARGAARAGAAAATRLATTRVLFRVAVVVGGEHGARLEPSPSRTRLLGRIEGTGATAARPATRTRPARSRANGALREWE